jgi:hypothetical protein
VTDCDPYEAIFDLIMLRQVVHDRRSVGLGRVGYRSWPAISVSPGGARSAEAARCDAWDAEAGLSHSVHTIHQSDANTFTSNRCARGVGTLLPLMWHARCSVSPKLGASARRVRTPACTLSANGRPPARGSAAVGRAIGSAQSIATRFRWIDRVLLGCLGSKLRRADRSRLVLTT